MKVLTRGARGLSHVTQRCNMSQLSSLPRALSSRRSCSASPWWEPSSDIADAEGGSSSGSRGLDQVLREFRIQKAAPDWLPLLPGGSFWVPPEEIPELKESSGVPAIEPATEGELFAMIMPSGWPAPSTVDALIKKLNSSKS